MNTEMNLKVREDNIKNSEALLRETVELAKAAYSAAEFLLPYDRAAKEAYGPVPKFLAATCNGLKSLPLSESGINYPSIVSIVQDGAGMDEGMQRLHDALYKLGALHKGLTEKKFMIKTDAEREVLRNLAKEVCGGLCIFLLTQFELTKTKLGYFAGVVSYCETQQNSDPAALTTMLYDMMKASGQEPYGYEAISEYRDDMLDIDPMFVAECEESNFPLTSDLCKLIIGGALPIAHARGLLAEHLRSVEETEVKDMTPANMLAQMNLT